MSVSAKEIKEILEVLERSGWDEARVEIDDVTLTVAKGEGGLLAPAGGAAPAPSAPAPAPAAPTGSAPAPPPAAAPAPAGDAPASGGPAAEGDLVTAPSVGIFWRAPEPGAQPFVEEGQAVEAGDTLCIIEVMKLMNHVAAEQAGTVVAVHAENGDSVEHGSELFTIAPAA